MRRALPAVMFLCLWVRTPWGAAQPAPHDASVGDAGLVEPVDPEGDPVDLTEVLPDGATARVTVTPIARDDLAIASGRGVSVTAGELYLRLRQAPAPMLRRYATEPGVLQALSDRMLSDRLLVAEARRRGLENDPIVRETVERALVSRMRATVFNPLAGDVSQVTEADMRRWYAAHPERFNVPEHRRARVIFLTDRVAATRVLRLATAMRRGQPVNDFRRLAGDENTVALLRDTQGDLRDVTPVRTDIDPALRDAVMSISREGEVLARVVPGRWESIPGFFVVRYISHRPALHRTLADSLEWLRLRILLERRVEVERAEVERLSRAAGVVRVPLAQVVSLDAGPNASGDGGGWSAETFDASRPD